MSTQLNDQYYLRRVCPYIDKDRPSTIHGLINLLAIKTASWQLFAEIAGALADAHFIDFFGLKVQHKGSKRMCVYVYSDHLHCMHLSRLHPYPAPLAFGLLEAFYEDVVQFSKEQLLCQHRNPKGTRTPMKIDVLRKN